MGSNHGAGAAHRRFSVRVNQKYSWELPTNRRSRGEQLSDEVEYQGPKLGSNGEITGAAIYKVTVEAVGLMRTFSAVVPGGVEIRLTRDHNWLQDRVRKHIHQVLKTYIRHQLSIDAPITESREVLVPIEEFHLETQEIVENS